MAAGTDSPAAGGRGQACRAVVGVSAPWRRASRSRGRVRVQWIFDRADYTFLGEHTVALTDGTTAKKGDVTGQTAVLRRALVNALGTRP
ncbi:hypothetical protein [Kitasatospora sp. NPDC001095]